MKQVKQKRLTRFWLIDHLPTKRSKLLLQGRNLFGFDALLLLRLKAGLQAKS